MRRLTIAEEQVLLAAVLAGCARAWRRFFLQYQALVIAKVARVLAARQVELDWADREDLVAHVWLHLLDNDRRQLRRWDPALSKLSNWIAVQTWSAVGRWLAMRTLERQRVPTVHDRGVMMKRLPYTGQDAHELAEQHQVDGRMRAGLDRLRRLGQLSQTADMVVGLTLRGWNIGEVSDATGVSRQRVHQHLQVAPGKITRAMAAEVARPVRADSPGVPC